MFSLKLDIVLYCIVLNNDGSLPLDLMQIGI